MMRGSRGGRRQKNSPNRERRRQNRKRTAVATTLRRINAKARERQAAWLDPESHPNVVQRLTTDIDELFAALRVLVEHDRQSLAAYEAWYARELAVSNLGGPRRSGGDLFAVPASRKREGEVPLSLPGDAA